MVGHARLYDWALESEIGLVTRNVSNVFFFSFLSISSGKGSELQGCALKSCAFKLPGEGRVIILIFLLPSASRCLPISF